MLRVLACGFLVADIVTADLEKVAGPGELVRAPRGIVLAVGGHPANVAIDLVKLGVDPQAVGVCGAVGHDIFGDFIVNTLSEWGLRLFIERVPAGTNKNVILVVKGEDRRFHIETGASDLLRPELIAELVKRERPGIFYLASGITDLVDRRIGEVFAEAKQAGALTFADLLQPHRKGWDYILPALPYVDIFHCNDVEARRLTGEESLEAAVRELLSWGVKLALITRGERSAFAVTRSLLAEQPTFKVEVVDPTGAGDAFCAGILLWFLERGASPEELSGKELAELLLLGQAVGASACTAPGTTEGVSRGKVEQLIREQGESILLRTSVKPL